MSQHARQLINENGNRAKFNHGLIVHVDALESGFSAKVLASGSCQPECIATGKNRESAIKQVLRLVAIEWLTMREQSIVDSRTRPIVARLVAMVPTANTANYDEPVRQLTESDCQRWFEDCFVQLDFEPTDNDNAHENEAEIIECIDYENASMAYHDDDDWKSSYENFTGRELTLEDL